MYVCELKREVYIPIVELVARMWHESRRQEKRVKGMIIDYQKRAERRKDHYEKKVRYKHLY